MSQRKSIRTQLRKPSVNVAGKYSGLMRFASGKKVNKINGDKRPWHQRFRPGKIFRSGLTKTVKNETLQKGVLTAATIGTVLAVMPKEILNKAAETVQEAGETIFNIGESMGNTAGSLIKAVGVGADVFSNGLGFLS